MKKINVITIDGPSASGKGALARGIANSLGFNILDSGVLYRLYAYLSNMSFSPDEIANQIEGYVEFKKNKILQRHEGGKRANNNEAFPGGSFELQKKRKYIKAEMTVIASR